MKIISLVAILFMIMLLSCTMINYSDAKALLAPRALSPSGIFCPITFDNVGTDDRVGLTNPETVEIHLTHDFPINDEAILSLLNTKPSLIPSTNSFQAFIYNLDYIFQPMFDIRFTFTVEIHLSQPSQQGLTLMNSFYYEGFSKISVIFPNSPTRQPMFHYYYTNSPINSWPALPTIVSKETLSSTPNIELITVQLTGLSLFSTNYVYIFRFYSNSARTSIASQISSCILSSLNQIHQLLTEKQITYNVFWHPISNSFRIKFISPLATFDQPIFIPFHNNTDLNIFKFEISYTSSSSPLAYMGFEFYHVGAIEPIDPVNFLPSSQLISSNGQSRHLYPVYDKTSLLSQQLKIDLVYPPTLKTTPGFSSIVQLSITIPRTIPAPPSSAGVNFAITWNSPSELFNLVVMPNCTISDNLFPIIQTIYMASYVELSLTNINSIRAASTDTTIDCLFLFNTMQYYQTNSTILGPNTPNYFPLISNHISFDLVSSQQLSSSSSIFHLAQSISPQVGNQKLIDTIITTPSLIQPTTFSIQNPIIEPSPLSTIPVLRQFNFEINFFLASSSYQSGRQFLGTVLTQPIDSFSLTSCQLVYFSQHVSSYFNGSSTNFLAIQEGSPWTVSSFLNNATLTLSPAFWGSFFFIGDALLNLTFSCRYNLATISNPSIGFSIHLKQSPNSGDFSTSGRSIEINTLNNKISPPIWVLLKSLPKIGSNLIQNQTFPLQNFDTFAPSQPIVIDLNQEDLVLTLGVGSIDYLGTYSIRIINNSNNNEEFYLNFIRVDTLDVFNDYFLVAHNLPFNTALTMNIALINSSSFVIFDYNTVPFIILSPCENKLPDGTPQLCEHQSICNTNGTFCDCIDEFYTGQYCNQPTPCLQCIQSNTYSCSGNQFDTNNYGICNCLYGYEGQHCENKKETFCDKCHQQNTEKCINTNVLQKCQCFDGFGGVDCSISTKCIEIGTKKCNGNGYVVPEIECINDDNSNSLQQCQCYNYFTGVSCDKCSLQCYNGGKPLKQCDKCGCPNGKSGVQCECLSQIGSLTLNGYNNAVFNMTTLQITPKNIFENSIDYNTNNNDSILAQINEYRLILTLLLSDFSKLLHLSNTNINIITLSNYYDTSISQNSTRITVELKYDCGNSNALSLNDLQFYWDNNIIANISPNNTQLKFLSHFTFNSGPYLNNSTFEETPNTVPSDEPETKPGEGNTAINYYNNYSYPSLILLSLIPMIILIFC